MASHSMNRIIMKTLAANTAPSISLQAHRQIGDGSYSVVFTTERDGYSGEVIASAFNDVFSGAFSIAPNTLINMRNSNHHIYSAVAIANTENHELNDSNVRKLGLKLVTANVFTDDNENVWKAVGEGDNKRIVLTSSDDYDKILSSKRTRRLITAAIAEPVSDLSFGDYVMYFNPASKQIDFGHATGPSSVYSRSIKAEQPVLAEQVLVVADAYSMDVNPLVPDDTEVVAISKTNKDKFLAYWAKLYKNTGRFYTDLETMMKNNVDN